MPLSATGRKVLARMTKTYKAPKQAKSVFYAMIRSGKLRGMERMKGR